MSAVFDFIKTIVQLARSGPPEIWQDHQIYRASGPMVGHFMVFVLCRDRTFTGFFPS